MKNEKFTGLDAAVYYIACVLTLGGYFVVKTAMKKAIQEMLEV